MLAPPNVSAMLGCARATLARGTSLGCAMTRWRRLLCPAVSPTARISDTLTVSERRRRYPLRFVASNIVGRVMFKGWS
uniref:Putative secreted protein n=1 Tax=Ixodes ricinus TaxID=34613 RepID=A0A6B0UC42_IXORI